MEVGKLIRRKRREKKLTQEEAAIRVEISRRYLSDVERGIFYPGSRILVSLAVLLDIDLNELKIDAPEAAGDDNEEPAH